MARSIRIQFCAAHYPVMARGNRREAIFMDDDIAKVAGQAPAHDQCFERGNRGAAGNS